MSFSVYNSNIILCSSDNLLLYNYEDETESFIELEKLITDKDSKQHNNIDIDEYHGITSVKFSHDGEYFCVCTNRKQLFVYKSYNGSLVLNRTLVRAASQVRFTPNNDIVVADKSGDVYLYHVNSNEKLEQKDIPIVGHLSMLLDVLVTHDSKYLITADRDEKIRVSKFPNSYNIESYCLGHKSFVTNICELPHDPNILISGGGDGALKFWHYKYGQICLTMDYFEGMKDDDLEKLNNTLEELGLGQKAFTLPVKHLRVTKWDDNRSILVTTFYGSGNMFMYVISGIFGRTVHTSGYSCVLKPVIEGESEPLECLLQKKMLWLLYNSKLIVYDIKEDQSIVLSPINYSLVKLNRSWQLLRSHVNNTSFYPILYKRKFDNVQEYQERKKNRLMNVSQ